MKKSFDVIIVGAGPAGSSATFFLGKSGFKVLLLDKEQFPRDKTCVGGISPRSLKILEEIINLRIFEINEFQKIIGVKLFSPNGSMLEGTIPKIKDYLDYGYVIPRTILDKMLVESAISNEVKFVREEVLDLVIHDNFVKGVKTNKNIFESKIVILANGANSGISKRFGFLEFNPELRLHSVIQHFEGVQETNSYIEIYYEKDLLPAYFWFFPEGKGKANIGLGMWGNKKGGRNLNTILKDLIMKHENIYRRLKHALPKKIKSWPIRFKSTTSKTYDNGIMVSGDAAGFANPLTGEGIYYALESGKLAAETAIEVLRKGDYSREMMRRDEDAWRKTFNNDLEYSHKLNKIISNPETLDSLVHIGHLNPELNSIIQGALVNVIPKEKLFESCMTLVSLSKQKRGRFYL